MLCVPQTLSKTNGLVMPVVTEFLIYYCYAQPAIACSKLTIETLEHGMKYVQS